LVPGLVCGVVALVVSVRVGGGGSAGDHTDGVNDPAGQEHLSGDGIEGLDDLLDRDQYTLGGQDGLLLDAGDAPQLYVAGMVGALGVDDRGVGVDRGDGGHLLSTEGAGHGADVGVVTHQVGAA